MFINGNLDFSQKKNNKNKMYRSFFAYIIAILVRLETFLRLIKVSRTFHSALFPKRVAKLIIIQEVRKKFNLTK